MVSLKKQSKGFTIIELMIVIIVIGVLGWLVVSTYGGIQSQSRNAIRKSDIIAIQYKIEKFFQKNGYYPSFKNLNSTTWVNTNMDSLSEKTMIDPSSNSTTPTLVDSANGVAKEYAYYPTDSSGSSANCEANDTTCAKYTLKATYEGVVNGQSYYSTQNLD